MLFRCACNTNSVLSAITMLSTITALSAIITSFCLHHIIPAICSYMCLHRTFILQRSTVTSIILFCHHLHCALISLVLILSSPLSIFHYTSLLLIICSFTHLLLFVLYYGSPHSPLVYKYLVLCCIPYLIINYESVFLTA